MAEYTVRCECGRGVTVSGAAAGGEVACGCGRRVAVPSLSQLRADAGESALSPELVIQAELTAGTLPAEADCVGCGAPDVDVVRVAVVCERVTEKSERASGLSAILLDLLTNLPLAALAFGGRTDEPRGRREVGRDVQFRLPFRACPICARTVPARDLLARTPLYARLLAKYPGAVVGRAGR